jgi:hypothetical protein
MNVRRRTRVSAFTYLLPLNDSDAHNQGWRLIEMRVASHISVTVIEKDIVTILCVLANVVNNAIRSGKDRKPTIEATCNAEIQRKCVGPRV